MSKQRVDVLLAGSGLADSREKARSLIMAGDVRVDGETVIKPGTLVRSDAVLDVLAPPAYVSRGGVKLSYALDVIGLDVTGGVAVDIGASTGGFTDCLLQRGVERVYAVDVGYGQLDYRLRIDPRVVVLERVNARYPISLPEKLDFAVFDVSFISLEKVIPSVVKLVKPGGWLLALFKPQFEVERFEVGKGGVVRDPQVHAGVLGRFVCWLVDQGFRLGGMVASPILGAEGNREFLFHLRLS